MPKFFAVKDNFINDTVVLRGGDAAHIAGALRGKPGDAIIVCDGLGRDYAATLASVSPGEVVAVISDEYPSDTEPELKVTLFQALPKGDKFEFVIQKCVELGVYEIVPVITERTVVRLNEKSDKKLERYNSIAEAAAKQCMRGIIPRVRGFVSLAEAAALSAGLGQAFVAYENEYQLGLKEYLKGGVGTSLGIFIGAEGGFTPEEIAMLKSRNIPSVSLGRRVLRAETAGLAAMAIIMYEEDNLLWNK
jgi:16S rRNA (uracil1498-N3)-methyltransferase